jgi:hypothetical protein
MGPWFSSLPQFFPQFSWLSSAVFSSFKILKILQDSPSHRIFGRVHGALNIGKKITNYTV